MTRMKSKKPRVCHDTAYHCKVCGHHHCLDHTVCHRCERKGRPRHQYVPAKPRKKAKAPYRAVQTPQRSKQTRRSR